MQVTQQAEGASGQGVQHQVDFPSLGVGFEGHRQLDEEARDTLAGQEETAQGKRDPQLINVVFRPDQSRLTDEL